MFKKFAALAAAAALSLGVMTGCGASGTTADSTGYSAENPLVLTLAHGLSETHTVHIAMTQFADEVAEKTDGRIHSPGEFQNFFLGSCCHNTATRVDKRLFRLFDHLYDLVDAAALGPSRLFHNARNL